jgi:hypothetical protein
VARGQGSKRTKPVFVTMVVAAAILAVFISCVGRDSSSAEQKSTASPTKTPAKSSATKKPTPAPTTHPRSTHPPAATPTPTHSPAARSLSASATRLPIPVGAIAAPPGTHRSTAPSAGKADDTTGTWHDVAIIAWVLVGVLAITVTLLAVVAKRQRGLPLTYVRPRTDRRDRP